MANSGAFHPSVTLQALVVLSVFAVLVADVGGQNQCPPFSCGDLHNISYPFRRPGDPPECGVQAYELVCSTSKATIYINTGTYYVTRINYTDSFFWVVDANLDMHSSCPLPRSDQLPYTGWEYGFYSHESINLVTYSTWACFVNCSRAITNSSWYKPVTCLSVNNSSFVYVSIAHCDVAWLAPSCGYLAMIPFGGSWQLQLQNASYVDIVEFIRKGFVVRFPIEVGNIWRWTWIIKTCLNNSISYFHEQMSSSSIQNQTSAVVGIDMHFLRCVNDYSYRTKLFWAALVIVSAIYIMKFIIVLAILSRFVLAPLAVLTFLAYKYWKTKMVNLYMDADFVWEVLCRFVLVPLAILTYLAYKFWKTRITIDAVEKFLRMQHIVGPTRYAYTDITAVTSHFRDKLGQGGYGSVYKGTLLPGDIHVAVKMLSNSNCNGEEFISEVSTIGRIHHVNVVRLVGFCSEEMRRALVYEYMPRGSLEKYIFSAEKNFSWDKLTEIALGIARGINYLHQGCEMQILHFDIKPHNILLDSNFVPKVADFGLAKLYPRDNSFMPVSAARGTIGYIAPEMISRSFGVISSKSDVYSFGMLLLEMAGGRRNADQNAANSSQAYYPSWVYDRLTEQAEVGELSFAAADMHELERKMCIIGLCCIQMKSHDRPTMSEVIEMLEAGVDGLQVPSRPFFCDDELTPVGGSYHLSSELTAISEEDE